MTLVAALILAGCGGADGGSATYSTTAILRDALIASGMECSDYELVGREDREMIQKDATDVAKCMSDGESLTITIWKDNNQRDQYIGVGETVGCPLAEAFGLGEVWFVVGDGWTVQPSTKTVSERLATTFGGKARQLC